MSDEYHQWKKHPRSALPALSDTQAYYESLTDQQYHASINEAWIPVPIGEYMGAENTYKIDSGIITFDVPHNAGVQIPLTMPASAMPTKKSRKKKDETP